LVLINTEVPNYFAELLKSMEADIIKMEYVRIGNVFEVA
jgi:hypothetical protein